jgi:hypothetical protein
MRRSVQNSPTIVRIGHFSRSEVKAPRFITSAGDEGDGIALRSSRFLKQRRETNRFKDLHDVSVRLLGDYGFGHFKRYYVTDDLRDTRYEEHATQSTISDPTTNKVIVVNYWNVQVPNSENNHPWLFISVSVSK